MIAVSFHDIRTLISLSTSFHCFLDCLHYSKLIKCSVCIRQIGLWYNCRWANMQVHFKHTTQFNLLLCDIKIWLGWICCLTDQWVLRKVLLWMIKQNADLGGCLYYWTAGCSGGAPGAVSKPAGGSIGPISHLRSHNCVLCVTAPPCWMNEWMNEEVVLFYLVPLAILKIIFFHYHPHIIS